MKKAMAILTLLIAPALAEANYTCTGTVDDLALTLDGVVVASIGPLRWVYLCQIGGSRNGVGSEACKAIYAHLLSAKTTGKQEMFWFSDSLTCTSHPTWQDLTGWYFGPDFQ
jgi:hypothetical protein